MRLRIREAVLEGIVWNICGRLYFALLAFRSRQMFTLYTWEAVHSTHQTTSQDTSFRLYPLLNSPLCPCIDLVHIVPPIFISPLTIIPTRSCSAPPTYISTSTPAAFSSATTNLRFLIDTPITPHKFILQPKPSVENPDQMLATQDTCRFGYSIEQFAHI